MHIVNKTLPAILQAMMFVVQQQPMNDNLPDSYNYYLLEIGQEINTTKCYGVYGCFSLNPPWTSEQRPISLYPDGFNTLKPVYMLYTKHHNPKEPTIIDLNDHEMIKASKIDPNLKVYVITHGYMESGHKQWITHMANELFTIEDCSVIVVDWGSGSSPPYTQAVANIRLVGAMTAHLLAALADETENGNLEHVHCIGHSLGAHMLGYAGFTLQRDFGLKLGRITGLDPAEPHFAKAGPPVRLDRTAAHFVDIIHTDASAFIRGGLGITETIGHVDFYVNGGSNQPGCDQAIHSYVSAERGSFINGIRKFLACNHVISHEYFLESIKSTCPYMAISCNSYEDFKTGKCFECNKNGQHCMKFGYHSREHYRQMIKSKSISKNQMLATYLMTGSHRPYCRAHYRITVRVSNEHESKLHGGEIGQLWVTVFSGPKGTGKSSTRMPLNPGGYHAPGEHYRAVVPAHAVPRIESVEVEWDYHSSIFNPLTWRLLSTPKIFVDSITVDAMEIKQSVTVCPEEKHALVSKKPQFMLTSHCA